MIRNKPLLAIPFTSTRGMFFSLLSNISKLLNFVRPNIFDDNAIPPEPFTPFFFRDDSKMTMVVRRLKRKSYSQSISRNLFNGI